MSSQRLSQRRVAVVASLLAATMGCIALVVLRDWHAGEPEGGFLIWNLGLAWIPFLVALGLYDGHRRGVRSRWLVALGLVWLAFLPNAPYILTDLVHLGELGGAPLWLDAVTIGAAASTGLVLGFLSLYLVQTAVAARFGAYVGWAFAAAALALSSVGIYLGRVLRFNSWDVLADPGGLAAALGDPLTSPSTHARGVGIVAALAAALAGLYCLMHALGWLRAALDDAR